MKYQAWSINQVLVFLKSVEVEIEVGNKLIYLNLGERKILRTKKARKVLEICMQEDISKKVNQRLEAKENKYNGLIYLVQNLPNVQSALACIEGYLKQESSLPKSVSEEKFAKHIKRGRLGRPGLLWQIHLRIASAHLEYRLYQSSSYQTEKQVYIAQ